MGGVALMDLPLLATCYGVYGHYTSTQTKIRTLDAREKSFATAPVCRTRGHKVGHEVQSVDR